MFLHSADHWRRSTHQDLNILGRFRAVLFNHILSHKPNTAFPTFRRGIVEYEVQFELVLVIFSKLFELLPQQDIFLIDVCKDETYLCFIGWIFEDCTNDLEHGGDSCAAGNHTKGTDEAWTIHHLTFRTLHFDSIADFHIPNVFGDVSSRITLYISEQEMGRKP
jgi:hypothetical protein